MTNIRDIKEEDVEELVDLAKKNDHGLWRPTNIIEIDGKIKGSISIGGVPLVTMFMDKEVKSPTALMRVFRQSEKIGKEAGFCDALVCCNEDSPIFKFMPKFGFSPYQSVLWYKELENNGKAQ
jgi:hypothetical protein